MRAASARVSGSKRREATRSRASAGLRAVYTSPVSRSRNRIGVGSSAGTGVVVGALRVTAVARVAGGCVCGRASSHDALSTSTRTSSDPAPRAGRSRAVSSVTRASVHRARAHAFAGVGTCRELQSASVTRNRRAPLPSGTKRPGIREPGLLALGHVASAAAVALPGDVAADLAAWREVLALHERLERDVEAGASDATVGADERRRLSTRQLNAVRGALSDGVVARGVDVAIRIRQARVKAVLPELVGYLYAVRAHPDDAPLPRELRRIITRALWSAGLATSETAHLLARSGGMTIDSEVDALARAAMLRAIKKLPPGRNDLGLAMCRAAIYVAWSCEPRATDAKDRVPVGYASTLVKSGETVAHGARQAAATERLVALTVPGSRTVTFRSDTDARFVIDVECEAPQAG